MSDSNPDPVSTIGVILIQCTHTVLHAITVAMFTQNPIQSRSSYFTLVAGKSFQRYRSG